MRYCLIAVLLLASFPAAAHGPDAAVRKVAEAANTLGMRRYRAGELVGAEEQFRVAIDFDESYVLPHYNLACVASRLGDAATAVSQLRWLAVGASGDPLKRARLAKAASDRDLDFVSALPEVRALLGLKSLHESLPSAWLTERGGVWSAEPTSARDDCAERSYTLTFHGDGSALLAVHEQCRAAAAIDESFAARLNLTPVSVAVEGWSVWPAAAPLTFVSCAGVEAPGSCFVLSNGRQQLGPFHRGRPRPRAKATTASTGL